MIDHIAFVVANPEKTAEMLARIGYHVTRRTPHHGGSVEVESEAQPGLILELCTKREQDSLGFNHVCMRLADQAAYDELEAQGMTFNKAPHLSVDSGRWITNHIDEDGIKWQVTF